MPYRDSSVPVTVRELIRYFRRLATLASDPATGNRELADALSQLATALEDPTGEQVRAFLARLSVPQIRASTRRLSQQTSLIDTNVLAQLPLEQITGFLQHASRQDLVALGQARFGLSRSMLERLRREEIERSIQAAARNEESIHAISKQAEDAGRNRRS